MSQRAFAASLGVTAPYIQAVELDQHTASVDLAERVRSRKGASTRSILERSESAVDTNGQPYTAETYTRILSKRPELPPDDLLQSLWEPMNAVIATAAASKSALALSIIRDKLQGATKHILVLDGVSEVLASQLFAGDESKTVKPRESCDQDDPTAKPLKNLSVFLVHHDPRPPMHASAQFEKSGVRR